MEDNFSQPLIGLKQKDHSFHFYKDKQQLGICTYWAYKDGYYQDLTIFDTRGNAFAIKRAFIVKYRTFPLTDWLLLSPVVELDFEFEPVHATMDFEQFRRKLLHFVKTDSYFENVGKRKALTAQLQRAANYQELSQAFDFMRE